MSSKHLNYFEFKGEKYYVGSWVKLKADPKTGMKIAKDCDRAKIIDYSISDDGKDVYTISFYEEWVDGYYGMCIPEKAEDFIEEVEPITEPPEAQFYKDTEVDDVVYGWIIYLFVMAVGTIFKDAIGIWIIASLIFFPWRKKKLFKGYY